MMRKALRGIQIGSYAAHILAMGAGVKLLYILFLALALSSPASLPAQARTCGEESADAVKACLEKHANRLRCQMMSVEDIAECEKRICEEGAARERKTCDSIASKCDRAYSAEMDYCEKTTGTDSGTSTKAARTGVYCKQRAETERRKCVEREREAARRKPKNDEEKPSKEEVVVQPKELERNYLLAMCDEDPERFCHVIYKEKPEDTAFKCGLIEARKMRWKDKRGIIKGDASIPAPPF
jgi:hypothetical protein